MGFENTLRADIAKAKAVGLENINKQLEKASPEERGKLFGEAERTEGQMDKLESRLGINSAELMELYGSITPEDAREILESTFRKMQLGATEKALLRLDELRNNGGKIIRWASKESPREAAMIAAAVMVLTTMADGLVSSAQAQGASDNRTYLESTNVSSQLEKNRPGMQVKNPGAIAVEGRVSAGSNIDLAELLVREKKNQGHMNVPADLPVGDEMGAIGKDGLFRNNLSDAEMAVARESNGNFIRENLDLNGLHQIEYGKAAPNITVNGEQAEIIGHTREGLPVYGNRHSIHSDNVHVGTTVLEK